jgi:hypothetical protein
LYLVIHANDSLVALNILFIAIIASISCDLRTTTAERAETLVVCPSDAQTATVLAGEVLAVGDVQDLAHYELEMVYTLSSACLAEGQALSLGCARGV